MAEEQQQESSEQTRSYGSLTGDKDYTDGLFYVLKDLGIDVDYQDKEGIVDAFMTRKRFFEKLFLHTLYKKQTNFLPLEKVPHLSVRK